MAELNVGEEVVEVTAEEIADVVVELYRRFNENRDKIKRRIRNFAKKCKARDVLQYHARQYDYTIVHTDEDFFIDGHKLINDIRELLELETVEYRVGILDQISNKSYSIDLTEEEFNPLIRTRGQEKSGLMHSLSDVQTFLEKNEKKKDITDKMFSFLKVLENKAEEENFKINYGNAFEAFGLVENKYSNLGDSKQSRYDIYRNYFGVKKNTLSWITGGDIGNMQYKLIRIYKDDKGQTQVSSASVTSTNSIIQTLTDLEKFLPKRNEDPKQIAFYLAKTFTQMKIPDYLNNSVEKKVEELLQPFKNKSK